MVDDVAADLALSPAAVGLLTGLPVLCFALASPAASALVARLGVERVVSLALLTVALGTVLRSTGGATTAFAGTALIGLAITAGNIAVPVVVRRDFRARADVVTGMYTAAMNFGSVLATALTLPVAEAVGWRWALALWVVLVPLAWVPWRAATRGRTAPVELAPVGADADAAGRRGVLARPITWFLTVMFAGQSFAYYGTTAWLPKILHDSVHLDAGAAGVGAALFQGFAIAGALGVPAVLARGWSMRAAFAVIAAGWLALPLGLLLAPQWWAVWIAAAGVAQGGNFTVVFTTVVRRAGTVADARRTSATVQTVGYGVAALGPSVIGAVHASTDDWTVPLVVLLGAVVALTVAGLVATGTPRTQPPRTEPPRTGPEPA
ncbi:CP family cyanate transporter-like MFS transporter [Sediminihabitans luteus]|uniref:CP family cyanate transporter-like MFS transporter n=1 Tax=Sediminihabitans luteus TaxID=1138585 RepID=A0A2M9CDA6_9CELL|nr:MFS transporter [Sediminihabitans luteus]PJJ69855.1 CP family cyanate transporter-like MFS transporter [Sediminihabitans luteus]GII99175.1 cyanate transporter [Sediminihabitans luteus]